MEVSPSAGGPRALMPASSARMRAWYVRRCRSPARQACKETHGGLGTKETRGRGEAGGCAGMGCGCAEDRSMHTEQRQPKCGLLQL
jgi:hypothetical protein